MSVKLPVFEKIKQSLGEDIYQSYNGFRRALLNAEIKTFGESHKIEYALIQKGRKEKLVFLHGFADCKENFYDSAHLLVLGYDLLVPDLPGFGRSFKKKNERYDVRNYAKWIVDLIHHEGWDKVHLMGNSLGGAIAIQIAATYPELVKSLVLLDPAGIVVPDVDSIYHEFFNDRVVFEIHSPLQFDYFLHRVFHNPPVIPPVVKEHLFREFKRLTRWNIKLLSDLLEGLTSMKDERLGEVTLNNRLHKIQAPTLILWGEKDSFFPPVTGHVARELIPNSTLKFLRGIGHSPQNEAPIRVMKEVKAFLKKVREKESARA